MKLIKSFGLLFSLILGVKSSRSDFYGNNDYRPELFKLLDDKVGVLNITLDAETWETMKSKTVLKPWDAASVGEDFGTEEASLVLTIGDDVTTLDSGKFKFELGGKGSRNFAKPGYNVKILDGDVHEVKQIRLRSTFRDASMLREKISTDLLYKIGLYTTSTNYVHLNVNNEYAGLYVVTNKVKKPMIKKIFGDDDVEHLYNCADNNSRFEDNGVLKQCINENEKLVNKTEVLKEFVDTVMNAKTAADLEDIIDIDVFLKGIAFEFITISWDHFTILCHNYLWYRRPDGKWQILYNDFDETWGQDLWPSYFKNGAKYVNKTYIPEDESQMNFFNLSIRDMDLGHYILKLLIHDDDTRFRRIVGEIVQKAFNPETLNKRIDEIVELIRPEVQKDREVEAGRYNTLGFDAHWTIDHFDTSINVKGALEANPGQCKGFGLKYFIEQRFKYLCHTYGINPETLELIEPRPVVSFWPVVLEKKGQYNEKNIWTANYCELTYPDLEKESYQQEEYNLNVEENSCIPKTYKYGLSIYEKEGDQYKSCLNQKEAAKSSSTATTTEAVSTTTIIKTTTSATTAATPVNEKCWSEKFGYPCCEGCRIFDADEEGQWGYENEMWCGILDSKCDSTCWSTKYGYSCCNGCDVVDTDELGQWGYEDDQWCGINTEKC